MAGNGKTPYFGLDTVPVDGSFEENGNKAMVADRILVDSLLHSTINHRHNGLPIVPELVGSPPEVELDVYPGNILGGQTLYYAVSLIDENGKEGNISSSSAIVIPNAVSAPVGFSVAPSITGGDLLGGSYQYVLTAYGSSNPDNETEPSPAVYANVLPTTHGSVTITYPALPAGASGWNIYRHKFNEQDFLRISIVTAAEATSAGGVFVDDGSYEPETNKRLPTSNNTSRTNSVLLTFPDPIVPVGYTWKVYRTSIAGYWANSFLYHVVETDEEEDDAVVTTFLDTGFPQLQGSPIVDMPVIYNPGPLDIGTETVGTIPSTRIDHSSVVLEQVDGFVDIAYEDPANLYFVELSEPGSFLVPELEEERTFYLVLKVAEMATPDLSLPVMEWEVSDGAATPSFETLTPIWYGSNPFEEEEVPADGVMIQVSVVQTGPTSRHLGLSWLAGSSGGTGTVTGPWTSGNNDLIQARLEGETVRIIIPNGFTPIQAEDWPGGGGSEPPYDVLPVGLRPTTTSAIGWADTQAFYDQTDSAWVTVAIFVGDNGSVYLVAADAAAVNPLGLGIPHQMTFPLTSPA